ncbi:uncharacterized protein PG986_012508 [Apiospora aurea]|uniref:Uncharacterized protein n=1 Tax=Apiospora aurea TaxID=335848 RepID=A0ABR1Q077_9PEZI
MWACNKSLPVIPAPDVVGLGVLIAFVGSSSLAVVGLFIQYLFFYSPKHEILATPEFQQQWTATKRPNPIDAVFLWRFRYVLRQIGIKCTWVRTSQEKSGLEAALDQCILTMADTQLGMGIAMLIYGFVLLSSGLSAYTWWNIVGLVWFSLITNLVAHSYLRTHYSAQPGKRRWRLCLVIALLLALMVSMVPTARMRTVTMAAPEHQSQLLTTRALCYFPKLGEGLDVSRGDRSSALAGAYVLALLCLVSISSLLLRLYERPGSETESAVEPTSVRLEETDHADHAEDVDVSSYSYLFTGLEGQIYFGTPWFPVALPTLAFATVLYIALLFALPLVNAMLPTEIVRLTGIWYLIYHPALILIFFLSCMAVEERTRSIEKAQATYRTLAAVTMFLSAVAVIDTIFGLGGIPMSYIAMGALGLSALIYILYGCVTGPGRLAKGKDRCNYTGDDDVEDQRTPLLGPRQVAPPPIAPVRTFPVRKAIRYHGPAKRARPGKSGLSKSYSYGTIS